MTLACACPLFLCVQGAEQALLLLPCRPQAPTDFHSRLFLFLTLKAAACLKSPALPTGRFPDELLPTLMATAIPATIPPPPTGTTTAFTSGACAERNLLTLCVPLFAVPLQGPGCAFPSPAPAPPGRWCLALRSPPAPGWGAPGLLLSPGLHGMLSRLWTKGKHSSHLSLWLGRVPGQSSLCLTLSLGSHGTKVAP